MASAKVSDLTNTRVVTAGTSGALSDDANLYLGRINRIKYRYFKRELRLQDNTGGQYIGHESKRWYNYVVYFDVAGSGSNRKRADQILKSTNRFRVNYHL